MDLASLVYTTSADYTPLRHCLALWNFGTGPALAAAGGGGSGGGGSPLFDLVNLTSVLIWNSHSTASAEHQSAGRGPRRLRPYVVSSLQPSRKYDGVRLMETG